MPPAQHPVHPARIRIAAGAALAGILLIASAVLPAPALRPAPCTYREVAPAVDTGAPGLEVAIAHDGSIDEMSVAGRPLPRLPSTGGFSARLVGGTPNLLPNGGFEDDADGDGRPDGWTVPARGGAAVDTAVAHSGRRSFVVTAGRMRTLEGFSNQISVRPHTFYVLSAWIRTRDVLPVVPTAIREETDPHSPVRIEVEQISSGARAPRPRAAHGYTATADWHRAFVGFRTGPDVHLVRVTAALRDGSGTAWFDDLSLTELFQTGTIALRGSAESADQPGGTMAAIEADVPGQDLHLAARVGSGAGIVRVDGTVESAGSADRALQVAFTLPLDAVGWDWGDYARRSRTIESGRYAYETASSLQTSSRYPFGAVYGDGFGVGVGVPLSEPRLFRIAYDTQAGLSITFDLGLSPSATALGPRASFSFVLFAFDPRWGFRAATERYYEIFPHDFTVRTDPRCVGSWFVAPPLYGLDPHSFGLGLDMVALGKASSQRRDTWGARYLPWDNVQGIYASAYGHHWAFYQPMGAVPTYEEAMAALRADAHTPGGDDDAERTRREATAALRSTARDANGRLLFERWRDFAAYYQNLYPDPAGLDWHDEVVRDQVDRAVRLAREEGARLDGIHLDSTSGMRRWGAADDHDRRHWAVATLPLTFSYDSGLVVDRGIFGISVHLRSVAGMAHRLGMIVSANFNGDEARTLNFVGADQIDYFGLEQGLADRATSLVTVDQFAMLKRTLAFQRPVSTLDHKIGLGKVGPEEADGRLQQNLFYGIYAGAWNFEIEADGGSGYPTWSRPEFRSVWARYSRIIHDLAVAGWEPVTDAWSSDPEVWVERFGQAGPVDGAPSFTLHNETSVDRPVVLTVDLASLGLEAPAGAVERVTRQGLGLSPTRDGVAVRITVPAHSTRVVAFAPTG